MGNTWRVALNIYSNYNNSFSTKQSLYIFLEPCFTIFLLAPITFFCLMDCQYVSSILLARVSKWLSQDQFDDPVTSMNPKNFSNQVGMIPLEPHIYWEFLNALSNSIFSSFCLFILSADILNASLSIEVWVSTVNSSCFHFTPELFSTGSTTLSKISRIGSRHISSALGGVLFVCEYWHATWLCFPL